MNCHKLVTENFTFEYKLEVFKEDISLPTNSILHIKVNSDNFSASTTMDIDVKMFKTFAENVLNIYNSLNGTAVLEEAYGGNNIEFRAKKNGHISVKGVLNNLCRNGFEQELMFSNEFDQTYLKAFAYEIYAEAEKYL